MCVFHFLLMWKPSGKVTKIYSEYGGSKPNGGILLTCLDAIESIEELKYSLHLGIFCLLSFRVRVSDRNLLPCLPIYEDFLNNTEHGRI